MTESRCYTVILKTDRSADWLVQAKTPIYSGAKFIYDLIGEKYFTHVKKLEVRMLHVDGSPLFEKTYIACCGATLKDEE